MNHGEELTFLTVPRIDGATPEVAYRGADVIASTGSVRGELDGT